MSARSIHRCRRVLLRSGVLLAALLALAVVGCGSSDDSGGTSAGASTDGASAPASTAPAADESTSAQMTEFGTEAGKKAGDPVDMPAGKTIGLLRFSETSDTDKRAYAAVEQAAKRLGIEVNACDPNFDPQKTKACMTSFVADKVDAILTFLHDPAELGGELKNAVDRGIPVIAFGAKVTDSPYVIQYVPDHAIFQKTFDDWFFAELKKKAGAGEVAEYAALGAPAASLASRVQESQRKEDDAADPDVNAVVTHDIDLSNIAQDVTATTSQVLTQHPDIAGLQTACDFCVPIIAQQVTSAGKTGDARPVVGGTFTTQQSIEGIRDGTVTGVLEYAWEGNAYAAVDRVAEHWARGTDLKEGADQALMPYPGVDLRQPYMVTKENAGESGPLPHEGPDYEAFYDAKWKTEFNR